MFSIVIIGQKWLAASVLEAVGAIPGVQVAGAAPADPGGRLAKAAMLAGIDCYELDKCPPADLALAAHCHEFIPATVRGRFRLGVLAYHPSLLPRHRGRDAVRWALHMREPVTGGTLYWMDDGADTGPIEAQGFCHILPGDTPAGLWTRELAPLGVKLFTEAVKRLMCGAPPNRMPQDNRLATFEPAFTGKKLG